MESHNKHTMSHNGSPYLKLLWMAILSFIAMYILMYSMVDRIENVVPNINQLYMAGLMTAPMMIIEMILMGKMYQAKKLNAIIIMVSIGLGIGSFVMIRNQTAVTDRQFLKSMIPHHAAAVLMVKETAIYDPEIKALADSIISAQEKEIRFMKGKLKEMDHQYK